VFLHKVKDPQIAREKVFQIASIVQNSGAVGLLATDIPYGAPLISRFGVEETVVDGVILLSSTAEGLERQRYIEIYKLRNTAHLKGRHSMIIGAGGIHVFPRYAEGSTEEPPAALKVADRLPSGIAGLDRHMGGGLLQRSVTLLAGSPGIGKSTFGMQFILAGVARGEPGLIFTLEESSQQLQATADVLGLPLRNSIKKGLLEVVYLSPERVRAAQFLSVLGDKIQALGARRLLLDGMGHIAPESAAGDALRQLLFHLVARFKSLDVTSLLTLESRSLYFEDEVTERGFSPLADNLLMLRYAPIRRELRPALRIIKTRGSAHDRGTYPLNFGKGGVHIGPGVGSPSAKGSAVAQSPPRTQGRRR